MPLTAKPRWKKELLVYDEARQAFVLACEWIDRGTRKVRYAFDFLVREHGFFGPFVERVAYETHHRYVQQRVQLDAWIDASSPGVFLTIDVGDPTSIDVLADPRVRREVDRYAGLERDAVVGLARFVREHREILSGELHQLELPEQLPH